MPKNVKLKLDWLITECKHLIVCKTQSTNQVSAVLIEYSSRVSFNVHFNSHCDPSGAAWLFVSEGLFWVFKKLLISWFPNTTLFRVYSEWYNKEEKVRSIYGRSDVNSQNGLQNLNNYSLPVWWTEKRVKTHSTLNVKVDELQLCKITLDWVYSG